MTFTFITTYDTVDSYSVSAGLIFFSGLSLLHLLTQYSYQRVELFTLLYLIIPFACLF